MSSSTSDGPAFYAQPAFVKRQSLRDWWTLLHPPYTAMHLSFVVVGACLVAPVNGLRLGMSVLAFFLAVGVGAHCLDELHGRPLTTSLPASQLVVAAVLGFGGAVALGIVGLVQVSGYLSIFILVGVFVALAYNLEWFGGALHTDVVFALSWGGFPLLTGFFAEHAALNVTSLVGALFATLIAFTQRSLSTPARDLRRRTRSIEGSRITTANEVEILTRASLLAPLERGLRSLCWATCALAVALIVQRFG